MILFQYLKSTGYIDLKAFELSILVKFFQEQHLYVYSADLMTEDSTLLCSVSDTVCRAMASLAAICFFFRLFRLWDGDHSYLNTHIGLKLQRQTQTDTPTQTQLVT